MLAAYQEAVGEWQTRWKPSDELLASILEMLHVLVIVTLSAYGAKNVPKPLQIPRPNDKSKPGPRAMSPQQLAYASGVKRG